MKTGKEYPVISGISGRYPESDSVEEFWDKLLKGIELSTSDDRRWPVGCMNLPAYTGKIKDISKFDAEFFDINQKDANFTDPQLRLLHETIYEAIWDSGLDPMSLRGSKTGFFLGYCYNDTMIALREDETKPPNYLDLAVARIAYAFDWHGPAILVDTACASSFSALNQALVSMAAGECNQAVVSGVGIQLRPNTSAAFHQLSMLSDDGRSKCLDSSADGYCRSEAVVSMLIQREANSKRIYARILECQTNCDGYKPEGITFPKYETQLSLMASVYKRLGLDPLSIEYVEAHVTGTKAGDPVESKALVDALRPNSDKPILVGCLKSNMGHSEGASALAAITKVAKIFQNGVIPPNINFKESNPFIEPLMKGIIKPVLAKTPFNQEIIPVNSFGFGGVNVHGVLQANQKRVTDEMKVLSTPNLPRLVNLSNRTSEGITHLVDFIRSQKGQISRDLLALINDVSKIDPEAGIKHRSFVLLDSNQSIIDFEQVEITQRKPIWLVFSPLFRSSTILGQQILSIPVIRSKLESFSTVLKPFGLDILKIVSNGHNGSADDIVSALLSLVALQIGLYELIRYLDLKPDGIVGHSLGEIAAAYADGSITGEQALLIAYEIGVACRSQLRQPGLMAKVKLTWEEIEAIKSSEIELASQDSKAWTIITGPEPSIKNFVSSLSSQSISCHILDSCRIPFNSSLLSKAADQVESRLKLILTKPKQRSDAWLCTSETPKRWDDYDCQWVTPVFFTRLLKSPSYFYQASAYLPKNAVFIEIGPSDWILSALSDKLGSAAASISMLNSAKKFSSDSYHAGILSVFRAIGLIYLNGYNPSIEKLYPKVTYPVARETPSIGHLLRWDHSASYLVTKFPQYFTLQAKNLDLHIDLMNPEWKFIRGHCIDGRVLFPATGYLFAVWRDIAYKMGNFTIYNIPIEFFNVRLHRATLISPSSPVKFTVLCNVNSEDWTILESGTICATGKWRFPKSKSLDFASVQRSQTDNPDIITLGPKDVYKELRVRGYDYGDAFQGIMEAASDGSRGLIKSNIHWIALADSCLQISILGSCDRKLYLPNYLEYVYINHKEMTAGIEAARQANGSARLEVVFDKNANIGAAPGLIIRGAKASPVARRQDTQVARLESTSFIPYDQVVTLRPKVAINLKEYSALCLQCLKSLLSNELSSEIDHETIKRIISIKDESHTLLSILYSVVTMETDANANPIKEPKAEFKRLVEVNRKFLSKDMLIKEPQGAAIEHQLQVIVENTCYKNINIAEVNFSLDNLHELVSDFFEFNGIRLNSVIVVPEEHMAFTESMGHKVVKYYPDAKRMSDIQASDLIIIRDNRTNLAINGLLPTTVTNFDLKPALEMASECLKESGFLLFIYRAKMSSVEEELSQFIGASKAIFNDMNSLESTINEIGLTWIGCKDLAKEGWRSVLLRKCPPVDREAITTIKVTNENFAWVDDLKTELIEKNRKVWLTGSGLDNGIMGLTTCLRKEPRGNQVRCYYTQSSRRNQVTHIPDDILSKDLAFNVVSSDGSLGSFLTSPIEELDSMITKAKHCYADLATKGDLSSFRWFQAQHDVWTEIPKSSLKVNVEQINIYYGALNFKDVMIATGRIPVQAYPEHFLSNSVFIGMEYSGIDSSGQRVMGICDAGSIGTSTLIDSRFAKISVPDNWTLAEAATIPVVYFTAYYCLFIRGGLRRGESVLIHAGSGGVGQAAISICLSMGCEVFTTVGTQAKRDFIKQRFPSIDDHHIGDSRSTSFEELVLKVTEGRGVDLVINSLAEDKFKASIRCLADFGRFLEIGKYDLIQDTKIDATILDNNKTYHICCLAHLQDDILDKNSVRAKTAWQNIIRMIETGIQTGEVRPLPTTVFERDQIEDAFRYMASGKHLGKVLIKVRDETSEPIPQSIAYPCTGQTFFCPDKSYIITGGLGGLGLELAAWMLQRGAINLILTSRRGPREPYQKVMLNRLRKNPLYKTNIIVSNEDCQSRESAERLIKLASNVAPIGGIFHLAMVLKDSLFENQTQATFNEVFAPKALSALYLDRLTRDLCENIDYFVAFSSISSGKGNAGQTNYGFANSTLERICEQRRKDNLHGLAIQWGALGDVGVVAELMGGNDISIAGTTPQRLPSIFDTLNKYLLSPLSVVSSLVLADKRRSAVGGKESLLRVICHILGVKDPSKLDPNSTLSELGLDSLMAVEIKQGLERDYDVVLSTQEIRSIKIKDIPKIEEKKKKSNSSPSSDSTSSNQPQLASINTDPLEIPKQIFIPLSLGTGSRVLYFPPIEGNYKSIGPVLQYVSRPMTGVNWTNDLIGYENIQSVASYYVDQIRENYPNESQFDLIGFSFGGLLALEVAIQLQEKFGAQAANKLILLDSSPDLLHARAQWLIKREQVVDESEAHVNWLVGFASIFIPLEAEKMKSHLLTMSTKEERASFLADLVTKVTGVTCDGTRLAKSADHYFHKIKLAYYYRVAQQFNGEAFLIRCTEPEEEDVEEYSIPDYGLSKYVNGKVVTYRVNGNHKTFLSEYSEQVGSYLDSTLNYLTFA